MLGNKGLQETRDQNEDFLLYFSPFYRYKEEKDQSNEPYIPKLNLEKLEEKKMKVAVNQKPRRKILKKQKMKHKFADRVKKMRNMNVRRIKRPNIQSQLIDFNDVLSLSALTNNELKPKRLLHNKSVHSHKRSKIQADKVKTPMSIKQDTKSKKIPESENFNTFAPDEEANFQSRSSFIKEENKEDTLEEKEESKIDSDSQFFYNLAPKRTQTKLHPSAFKQSSFNQNKKKDRLTSFHLSAKNLHLKRESSAPSQRPKIVLSKLTPSESASNANLREEYQNAQLQNLKSRIIDDNFLGYGSKPLPGLPRRKIGKKGSKRILFREHIPTNNRPMSSVLRSNPLIDNTIKRLHKPVKQFVADQIQKVPNTKKFLEDGLNNYLLINPFKNLAKPFQDPLQLPNEIERLVLEDEILQAKRDLEERKTSSSVTKKGTQISSADKSNIDFEEEKKNLRFKDIKRAQTRVLAEHMKGDHPVVRYGQRLKECKQAVVYATEDHVPEFSSSDEDLEFDNLTPRSNELYMVTKEIKKGFKENDEPPKTKITFYKIGKIIGKGAFGKVNLAMHILAQKLIAIKSIKREHTRKIDTQRKLDREIKILSTLDNSLFVRLYDVFSDDRYTYIVMTLCEGGSVAQYMRKSKWLNEDLCKHLFINVCNGIKILHKMNIAHRDIKPENILICRKGNIKICDFGISRKIGQREMIKDSSGTPAYMAPETFSEKAYNPFLADIWALGILLFTFLNGHPPFKQRNRTSMKEQILSAKFKFEKEVSQEAIDLCKYVLQLDPHKRPTISQ
ncbi:unnamed protein product [Moneuplotes crassus]|uniref:Protein kinase domain-containing protein n=1 Tax=Euplotes crassus TaxID=5936 RepID=A0AAD1XRU6_EUPCR|nr:unnamed protein product [Moneuplotes crassus]